MAKQDRTAMNGQQVRDRIYLCEKIECSFNTDSAQELSRHQMSHHVSQQSVKSQKRTTAEEEHQKSEGVNNNNKRIVIQKHRKSGEQEEEEEEEEEEVKKERVLQSGCGEEQMQCWEKDCNYLGKNWLSLRTHLVNKHKKRKVFNNSNNGIARDCSPGPVPVDSLGQQQQHQVHIQAAAAEECSRSARRVQRRRVQRRRFGCCEANCAYVGRNGHGLRVHLMRRHDIKVKTNDCSQVKTPEEEEATAEVRRVRKQAKERRRGTRKGNNMRFECKREKCDYWGESAFGLKVHNRRKHALQESSESAARSTSSTAVAPEDVRQKKSNRDVANAVEVQMKGLGCSELGCEFVGKNALALRTHRINGHRISGGTVAGAAVDGRTGRSEKERARSRRRALDRTVMSYQTKRKKKREKTANAIPMRPPMPAVAIETVREQRVEGEGEGQGRGAQEEQEEEEEEKELKGSSTGEEEEKKALFSPSVHLCRFPKCGQRFGSVCELREHIQSAHKRKQTLGMSTGCRAGTLGAPVGQLAGAVDVLHCYFPGCAFRAERSTLELRSHLLAKHSMAEKSRKTSRHESAQVIAGSGRRGGGSAQTQSREQCAFKVFKCFRPNCYFTGSLTLKGLRIHTKRNHSNQSKQNQNQPKKVSEQHKNLKIGTGTGSTGSTGSEPMRPPPVQRPVIHTCLVADGTDGKHTVMFKCSQPNCAFSVADLMDLRRHIQCRH